MMGRQVAVLIQVAVRQPCPLAVNLPTSDAIANQPERVAKAVVGSFGAVLSSRAAKLAHHDDEITRLIKLAAQLRQAACEVTQIVGQLACCMALVGVRVPAASGEKA